MKSKQKSCPTLYPHKPNHELHEESCCMHDLDSLIMLHKSRALCLGTCGCIKKNVYWRPAYLKYSNLPKCREYVYSSMQHVDTPQRHVHNRVILKVTKRFMNQWGVLAHFWQFIMFKERSRGPKLPILKRCKGIGGGDLDQKKAMYKWTPYQTFESIVIGAFKSLSWKLFSLNRLLAKVKHLTFTSLKFKILTLHKHCEYFINCQKRVKFFYQTVSFWATLWTPPMAYACHMLHL